MECVKALEKAGFYFKRQEGSHMILRRDKPFVQATVPNHKVIDRGTLKSILRNANLTVEEFRKYL